MSKSFCLEAIPEPRKSVEELGIRHMKAEV
jgi:hypothetical protein